jgi:hypothetical protein
MIYEIYFCEKLKIDVCDLQYTKYSNNNNNNNEFYNIIIVIINYYVCHNIIIDPYDNARHDHTGKIQKFNTS